jgi:NADPH:quinone reductase
MQRVVVEQPGGPERLQLVDAPMPSPGAGEALVKIAFSGVNFIDVYFRAGLYKADAPITLGNEAAGTVEQVGTGVTDFVPGDRVAYAMVRGSYADYAIVPAAKLVKVPDNVECFRAGPRTT